MMQTFDVLARCDVFCEWWAKPPRYRLYVGNELFSERTWIWEGVYLDENIVLRAPAGRYHVRLEMVDPEHSKIRIKNLRIDSGPAIIANDGSIQVYVPESANDTE
jgi:hypothetical protein